MTMDNGAEVLAKIPNPNAGPAFCTTASEVATRHFVCDSSRWYAEVLTAIFSCGQS